MSAIVRNTVWEYHKIAAGTEQIGDIIQYGGVFWVLSGTKTPDAGDKITYRRDLVIEIPKDAAATVFLDEGVVGYDATAKRAVAAGTGDFDIGKSRGGSASGVANVLVALNE